MIDEDVCERCGRDLVKMGVYRDYIHHRPGYDESNSYPCLPTIPWVEEMVKEMAERMEKTMALVAPDWARQERVQKMDGGE